MNNLYKELIDQEFIVLAVNVDEEVAKAEKFLTRFPVDYPVLLDTDASTAKVYRVAGMPKSFIIDQVGNIVLTHQGFKETDIDLIRAHVRALMKPLP
ncbi:MAG: TlpA disulfide reductase family protein [Pseudomonadales bacterium]|nr:TlpA disulfide reductase family protein [Pseudomonadales bacterium]